MKCFRCSRRLPLATALLTSALLVPTGTTFANQTDGPLDRSLPSQVNGSGSSPEAAGASVDVEELPPAPGVTDQASLEREVQREQQRLENLDRNQLARRAEQGERGAQVVLGADFAREAETLAFAPIAANDALSDAVRWYSLAASRGFPGAPALDQAGISFHPIRVQRPRP